MTLTLACVACVIGVASLGLQSREWHRLTGHWVPWRGWR